MSDTVKHDLKSISGHMIRGSAWMVTMRWAVRGIGLISTVILARLLSPDDYGLLGMSSVVVGFLSIFTLTGFDLALIQRTDAGRDYYDSAFTMRIIQFGVLALCIIFVAPFAADYFREPRVEAVMQVLALGAAIRGFENIGVVDFRKDLNFHKDFKFETIVRMASFFITISLAIYLRSYWALVIGLASAHVARVILSYVMHPYRPRLSLVRARQIWSFSKWILVTHLGNFLRNRFDMILVGRIGTTEIVGQYHVATEIASMSTSEVTMPLGRALFPTYAKLLHNPAEAARAFMGVLSLVIVVCFPLGFGIALVSVDLIPVLLGAQWIEAGPIMQWLVFAETINGVLIISGNYLVATGRPRLFALLCWANIALLLPALVFAGTQWGINGIVLTRALTSLLFLPVVIVFTARAAKLPLRQFAAALWRPSCACLVMAAVLTSITGMQDFHPALRLAIEVLFGVATYISSLLFFWYLSGRVKGAETMIFGFTRDQFGKRWPFNRAG
jgi:O-antigen/teichoic acid export membrane protein